MELLKSVLLLTLVGYPIAAPGPLQPLQHQFAKLFIWEIPSTPPPEKDVLSYNGPRMHLVQEIHDNLPRDAFYWGRNPYIAKITSIMKDMILAQPSAQGAVNLAAALRDKSEVNPIAWFNAVAGATIHGKHLQGLSIPSLVEILPGNFIPREIIDDLAEEIRKDPYATKFRDSNTCDATIDGSIGEDNGDENLLWYFREDIMINAHHWYWHLAYPLDSQRGSLNRKGELFYFFHHSALVRYRAERIALGLDTVNHFTGKAGAEIPIGYDSHLRDANSGRNWTAREPDRICTDINYGLTVGTPIQIDPDERSEKIDNVKKAIKAGELIPAFFPENPVSLLQPEGIDYLGSIIEANDDSINPELYDRSGIHTTGQNLLALVEDPDDVLHLPPGVLGEYSTAMRDPMYYSHLSFINDLFNTHKATLDPYELENGQWPLGLPGVTLESIKVQLKKGEHPENQLRTYFDTKQFDLSKGLDFNGTEGNEDDLPLYVCQKHLDHRDFVYKLRINVDEDLQDFDGKVNIRIFIGPREDKDGYQFSLEHLRTHMFIMDVFSYDLHEGINIVKRESKHTPLTIDFPQSLEYSKSLEPQDTPYCGCGWPHHMLVPRGTKEGFPFDLVAIVTKFSDDFVEDSDESRPSCIEAYIFCGLLDGKYPDKRPMGWPFDRKIALKDVEDPKIEDFDETVPNAAHVHITIYHDESAPYDDDK